MRIAFMGSPGFAVPALRALHAGGHEIAAVYCQPPRPAGRGHPMRPCAVQAVAEHLGLPVRTPARLRTNEAAQTDFRRLGLDAAVVAAYGLILPAPMLEAPRHGCLNIHASLLPRWRGAAPIQAAILAGDSETGVTIMRMDEGLDTGPILLQQAVPIGPRTTTPVLHDILAELGARSILRALAENLPGLPQPDQGVTYAPKLTREDARLDWTRDACELDRRVRALNPWPGTWTTLNGGVLKVIAAVPWEASGAPGSILDTKLTIACGSGALRLLRVQLAGRAPQDSEAFLRGYRRNLPFRLE
ncbi:MAG: methionyl-tRNA formyltransferase [Acetobacteraceae bacterium]|nr:methionyl-tRNA formyltransferase [Acetobacteraceae bacterium]MBV8589371.1 methionyl-tRNA formyltransferase [Acetobacteraceae bacterium]